MASALNDDVLGEIFSHFALDCQNPATEHPSAQLVNLGLVCHQWREAILERPLLWSNIELDCSRSELPLLFLERSISDSPSLTLYSRSSHWTCVDRDTEGQADTWDSKLAIELKKHLHRVKIVKVYGTSSDLTHLCGLFLDGEFKNIREFHLHNAAEYGALIKVDASFPLIDILCLNNVYLIGDGNVFDARKVNIHSPRTNLAAFARLVGNLKNLTRVQELNIGIFVEECTLFQFEEIAMILTAPQLRKIPLHCLKAFRVAGIEQAVLPILHMVDAPQTRPMVSFHDPQNLRDTLNLKHHPIVSRMIRCNCRHSLEIRELSNGELVLIFQPLRPVSVCRCPQIGVLNLDTLEGGPMEWLVAILADLPPITDFIAKVYLSFLQQITDLGKKDLPRLLQFSIGTTDASDDSCIHGFVDRLRTICQENAVVAQNLLNTITVCRE